MPRKPAPVSYRALRAQPRRGPIASDDRWYWQVYYNEGGAQHKVGGAPSGRYTTRQAKALLRAAWGSGEWATHHQAEEHTGTDRDRVAHLLEDYLAHQQAEHDAGRITAASWETYRHRQRRLLKMPRLTSLSILVAPRRVLLQEIFDRHAENYAPRTVQQDRVWLWSAWAWARDEYPEVITQPLPRIKTPKVDVAGRVPSLDEMHAMRDAMADTWHRRAYILAMHTGARVSELGSLRWEQVDWTEGAEAVTVLGKSKGRGQKVPRRIPLAPAALASLREQWIARGRASHGPVWPVGRAGKAIAAVLKRSADRRGVEPLTIHDVRRWMACELIDRVFGASAFSAKDYEAWMGHRFEMGLRTYTRARPGRLGGAAEAVGGLHADNVININERREMMLMTDQP